MKDKIKKILLLFVFTGTLFVSCTMEEEAIRNHNYSKDIKIYQKSFDELIKDSKFATSFNKLPKRKTNLKSSAQARTVMEEQYGFTITNSPVRVMQVGNSTSYTFHIERNTANSTYFENLVVQNDSIGNTTAHIIKYTPFMPMAPFAEHNSYSFSGNTEFTSIIYDDNYVNGKMVLECRDLYGFRCTGANGYNGSCTASPHIPMGQCTEYTPQCIKYTFITQSCTSYDDGLDDIGTGGGLSSGSGQSGGSGTGGSDPIYSDPLCPTCIELTPELSDFLADLSTEQLATWNALDYVVKRSIVTYLVQNNYSSDSLEDVNFILDYEDDGLINNEIVIIGPDIPIYNMEDYLSCFDRSQGARITIYADQPKSNTHNLYSSNDGVGHAFFSIQQGSEIATLGFYPESSMGSLFGGTSGIFGNDQNHPYDVSVSTQISSAVLNEIMDMLILNNDPIYDLHQYNCTDVAITIANFSNINIPSCESPSTWNGDTPGTMGQIIRNMTIPSSVTRNVSGGNSPSNNCN